MIFEDAEKFIETLKGNRFAGYKDWRLPTLEEAMSLMEPSKNEEGLYINSVFDKKQWWIWTMDEFKGELRAVWIVDFSVGYCSWNSINYSDTFVRAVRSEQSSKE